MKMKIGLILLSLSLTLVCTAAKSDEIFSFDDPSLNGASVITFDDLVVGTTDPVVNGVTFTGAGGQTRILFNDSTSFDSQFLSNTQRSGSVDGIDYYIEFSVPVSAFAADFTAVNNFVTIDAFNDETFLGTIDFARINPFAVLTRGLTGFDSPITHLEVSTTFNDVVLLDNVHFVSVPEPSSFILLALLGLAIIQRGPRFSIFGYQQF